MNLTEVTDKYNLILKPHWLSSTIYTLHHYHTVPQALLLMCVTVFMHGRIFGSFTLILCACVCTGDNTGPCRQRHGGKPPTSDGLCGFVCAECAFYISSARVYEKWMCGVYLEKSESSKWQLKTSLWMNSRQASRTRYVAHSETNSFYKSKTFMKYIRRPSIIQSTALMSSSTSTS